MPAETSRRIRYTFLTNAVRVEELKPELRVRKTNTNSIFWSNVQTISLTFKTEVANKSCL